jgi:hypothetical protein
MILCHLSKDLATNEISMKHEFMISQNCELGALTGSYDWLEGDWRGVRIYLSAGMLVRLMLVILSGCEGSTDTVRISHLTTTSASLDQSLQNQ